MVNFLELLNQVGRKNISSYKSLIFLKIPNKYSFYKSFTLFFIHFLIIFKAYLNNLLKLSLLNVRIKMYRFII